VLCCLQKHQVSAALISYSTPEWHISSPSQKQTLWRDITANPRILLDTLRNLFRIKTHITVAPYCCMQGYIRNTTEPRNTHTVLNFPAFLSIEMNCKGLKNLLEMYLPNKLSNKNSFVSKGVSVAREQH